MSELAQLTRVPKRPRDAPGTDGYHLEIHPGFEEEQKCYYLRVTTPPVKNPVSSSNNVSVVFPHIKLGAGMYVLDIERVVCTYTATTIESTTVDNVTTTKEIVTTIDGINANGTHMATFDGIGHTLTCTSNACTTDMKYNFFFGNSSTYKTDANTLVVTYSRNYDVMNLYTYSLPIENDTLNVSFTITDKDNYFVNTTTSPYNVQCIKEYYMVLRPNPSKLRYFTP
jgi:hypothetical protein